MELEVWSREAASCIATFPTETEALWWLFEVWTRHGDDRLADLSLSPEDDEWVLQDGELVQALRDLVWRPPTAQVGSGTGSATPMVVQPAIPIPMVAA